MTDRRNSSGRYSGDARRRELVRQVMRARRTIDGDMRPADGQDPAKAVLVERAKKWMPGEAPSGGAAPG